MGPVIVEKVKVSLDKMNAVHITIHFKAHISVKKQQTTHRVIAASRKPQDIQAQTERTAWMCLFDLQRLSISLSHNGVTRAESSEVIFVILLEVVLPKGRGFPDCLISHINHTLFIIITRPALCAAAVQPSKATAWQRVCEQIKLSLWRFSENKMYR